MMKRKIELWLEVYKCNYKKNINCRKTSCKYKGRGECCCTSQYKYAKKTLINYIKKTINELKNKYKY